MDRLLAVQEQIGQPLRPEDWQLIQDTSAATLASVIKGLTEEPSLILWGLHKTINGGVISITEGAIFTDGEIFFVPTAQFDVIEEYLLYLQQNFTTAESRVFKDTSAADVWTYRRYQAGLAAVVPDGALPFGDLPRLSDLQGAVILAYITAQSKLVNKQSIAYNTGFESATKFPYAKLVGNGLNQFMLIAAFTSMSETGKLLTLPVGYRPSGDITGSFLSTSGPSTGVVHIKKNGEVWVYGMTTRDANYITMQFPMSFDDPVGFDVPTGEGMS